MPASASRDVAIVTPSYAPDLDRCQLLCDSIDRHVTGIAKHYILVADHDHALFAGFTGARREVVRESDILLERFLCIPDPRGRRAWFSTFALPLRGWHVQQLRRIAIAHHVDHAGLLYCDSDMAFVRPFNAAALWRGEAFRLYRNPGGVHVGLPGAGREHMVWTRHAHALLGLPEPGFPADDHINNLVSWRTRSVRAMTARIEATTARPWLRAVARQRAFSECQIYGAFANRVAEGELHWNDRTPLCLTHWDGPAVGRAGLEELVEAMSADQVAIGIQSFTGTDPRLLRSVLGL